MKEIKIKTFSVIYLLILIVTFVNCRGFNLLVEPKFRIIINIVYQLFSLFSIFFMFTISKNNRDMYKGSYKYIFIVLFLFIFPHFLYTISKYNQSLFDFYKALYPYLSIFWIFPIIYLLNKSDSEESVFDKVSMIVFIGYIILIIAAFLKNCYDISLFKIVEWRYRNGNIRIVNLSSFMPLVITYLWNNVLNKGKKYILNIVMIIVILFGTIYVEQTRASILFIFAAMIFMFIFKKRSSINNFFIRFVFIIIMIVIISLGFVSNYTMQFSEENNKASTINRINEINFYTAQFKENPLFGIGLMETDNIYYYYNLPTNGSMNPADIGLVGTLGVLGLSAVFIFVIPMIKYGIFCLKIRKNQLFDNKSLFLIGLYLYILLSSTTLIVLNEERIVLFPFVIALFEYYKYLEVKDVITNN